LREGFGVETNMKKHILGALCALPGGIAHADTLDPIVITASRVATPAEEIPASITVIDKEEIEQAQANDVSELLRGVTGIDIGRNGGPGQTTSVFMRGTESDHTLVMIDGVPINPGTIGNAALQNIDPRLIDHIEIVRGPLSSLYGSAAIGGVINIITTGKVAEGAKSHFGAQAGSYDSLSLNAGTRMAKGPLNVAVNLSHQHSDGFPTKSSVTDDHGYQNDSINAVLGYALENHRFQVAAFSSRGNTEYDNYGSSADQDFDTSVLRAGLTSQFSKDWESRLTLSRMTDFIDQNQANYLSQYDYAHTTRYTVDWQNDVRLSFANRLTAGITLEQENTDALSYGSSFDVTLNNQAFYIQDQYSQGAHTATGALRLTRHDTFGDNLTWNLGYGYQLNDSTRLRASAGTAFRAPSGTDLYGSGGNPDLAPELSRSVEVGIRHQLDEHSEIDAAAYRTDIDDLIVYSGSYPTGRNENVDKARITGIELNYNYNREPWQFSAGGEWKRPWDETHDVILSRRARIAAKASLRYSQPRWDAGVDLQFQGERDDSFYNNTILDEYVLVNATARWHASRNLTIEGRIENLFDTDYELAGGYNTPDRSIYLGLRVESD
jgi:vitamin B12 transporter